MYLRGGGEGLVEKKITKRKRDNVESISNVESSSGSSNVESISNVKSSSGSSNVESRAGESSGNMKMKKTKKQKQKNKNKNEYK
jgi:hypothetical protein